ncbi:MAG: phosphatase PAP2 family protein [Chloroflexi bacterium]|nr:phosphatase PAP2 family protein [Chloroflexota bacterium]
MAEADAKVFLWINSWAGHFPLLDEMAKLVVSDYLIPAVFALILLGMWFGGVEPSNRERHQKAVFVATSALGIANLVISIINSFYFRPRPFVNYEVNLLFYQPTDSGFPANPMAVTFAIAAALWGVNRKLGTILFLLATLFALARVYAGVFYPLDVIAGAAIGIVMAYLMSRLRVLLEPLPTMVIKLARIFCLA